MKYIIKFTCRRPLKDMYWAGWGLGDKRSAKIYTKTNAIKELDKIMADFNKNGIITQLGLADFTGAKVCKKRGK